MKLRNLFTATILIAIIGFSIAGCDNGTNPGGGDNDPAVTEVTVTPATATVAQGQTKQFNATVTGKNNPAQTVTWTVTGGGNGTSINPSGLLTVAANETAATLTVRAASTVDTSKSGTATVTITAPVPSVSWAVHDLATWGEAVNGIRNGGDNKSHIITVTGDFSALVSDGDTFGSVPGITVNIEGNNTISLSSGNGRLLQIGEGQTVIVKNLTLQGRNNNNNPVVRINDGGTFRMEGSASVTGNSTSTSGGGVYIYYNGTFIMQDNATVSGNTVNNSSYDAYGGGVYVFGGTFIMQDNASVSGNTANCGRMNGYAYGGGVYVDGNSSYPGIFTMKDNATVKENTASLSYYSSNYAYGGGVYVDGGTFTLEDGAISDNTANGGNYGSANGGGVYVYANNGGTFTMQNGTISGNTAKGNQTANGGGVYASISITVFTMQGGAISGNTASATGSSYVDASGGGVYGNLIMQSGTISDNTVNASGTSGSTTVYASGGGVRGILTMQGGTISGNTVNASNRVNSNNVETYGGGVSGNPTKTGGTIYGNDAADDLRNIAIGGKGHAVYNFLDDNWRNATAGPAMNTDTYGFWLNE